MQWDNPLCHNAVPRVSFFFKVLFIDPCEQEMRKAAVSCLMYEFQILRSSNSIFLNDLIRQEGRVETFFFFFDFSFS